MNNKIYTIDGHLYSYEKVSSRTIPMLPGSDVSIFTLLVKNINTNESHHMVFVIAQESSAKIEGKYDSKENAVLHYLRDALNDGQFHEGFEKTISE